MYAATNKDMHASFQGKDVENDPNFTVVEHDKFIL